MSGLDLSMRCSIRFRFRVRVRVLKVVFM
jgi:hypothetical protein